MYIVHFNAVISILIIISAKKTGTFYTVILHFQCVLGASAIRRALSLKDKVVKNYLPAPKPTVFWPKPPGTPPCDTCNYCAYINKQTSSKDASGQKTFKCKHFATCNTTHVVYRLDSILCWIDKTQTDPHIPHTPAPQ